MSFPPMMMCESAVLLSLLSLLADTSSAAIIKSCDFFLEDYKVMAGCEEAFLAKVVIIGDSGVGKTNLMTKYCEGVFKESYVATIGVDFKLKDVSVDDLTVKLQVWDTAGQERFRNITQAYFKGAKAIILAYDITHADSFQNLSSWTKQIETVTAEGVVKMLVATKCDLEEQREVSPEEGRSFAQKHGMIHEQVSSKNGHNVEVAFLRLAQGIKAHYDRDMSDGLSFVLKIIQQNSKKKCSC